MINTSQLFIFQVVKDWLELDFEFRHSSFDLAGFGRFKAILVHCGYRHKITFKFISVQDGNRLATGFFDHTLWIAKFG